MYIHQGQFLKHSKDESHFSNMSFTTGSISQLLVFFTKILLVSCDSVNCSFISVVLGCIFTIL